MYRTDIPIPYLLINDNSHLRGPKGERGPPGPPGPSGSGSGSATVDYSQLKNNLQSDTTFMSSIKGKDGKNGDPGLPGKDGNSPTAEEVANILKDNQTLIDKIKTETELNLLQQLNTAPPQGISEEGAVILEKATEINEITLQKIGTLNDEYETYKNQLISILEENKKSLGEQLNNFKDENNLILKEITDTLKEDFSKLTSLNSSITDINTKILTFIDETKLNDELNKLKKSINQNTETKISSTKSNLESQITSNMDNLNQTIEGLKESNSILSDKLTNNVDRIDKEISNNLNAYDIERDQMAADIRKTYLKEDVYNKDEIDDRLQKIDIKLSDIYSKDKVYSKDDINELLQALTQSIYGIEARVKDLENRQIRSKNFVLQQNAVNKICNYFTDTKNSNCKGQQDIYIINKTLVNGKYNIYGLQKSNICNYNSLCESKKKNPKSTETPRLIDKMGLDYSLVNYSQLTALIFDKEGELQIDIMAALIKQGNLNRSVESELTANDTKKLKKAKATYTKYMRYKNKYLKLKQKYVNIQN